MNEFTMTKEMLKRIGHDIAIGECGREIFIQDKTTKINYYFENDKLTYTLNFN